MTSITFKNCYTSVTIEVEKDDMSIKEVLEDLIKPVLLGATYHQNNVDDIIYDRST